MKTFWKELTILDTIENIQDVWEEIKTSTLIRAWKKLNPAFMDDLEGFKALLKEVTTSVVEITRELELEVETEMLLNC